MIEITKKNSLYSVIKTPSGRSQFMIYHIDSFGVVIKVGDKGNLLTIPASCFEDVPNFLRGRGWIKIGAVHGVADEGTLDGYLQRFTHGTSVASYVAPILEKIGIVEIDKKRPARTRLKT